LAQSDKMWLWALSLGRYIFLRLGCFDGDSSH